jgi:hypothetical protein
MARFFWWHRSGAPDAVVVYKAGGFAKGAAMKATERATRAELRGIGVDLASVALGRAVVDLARRLDAAPENRAMAMLTRELRLSMAELHRRAGGDLGSEVDRFLGRIAATDGRDAAD